VKALVIDDDDGIIQSVSLCLGLIWPDSDINWCHLGNEGISMVRETSPELVVLDLGLPDISGYDALKSIRSFSKVPVIVLTVRSDEDDVVRAFKLGADDYITKPFRKFEFLARIQSALSKFYPRAEDTGSIKTKYGNLQFDSTLKQLIYNGKTISLTSTESNTLRILLDRQGKIVSYKEIEQELWGHNVPNSVKVIRVYVNRLREKLELNPKNPRLIITEPGIGYSIHPTGPRS